MSSPFNPKNYYRFFNSVFPNNTISAGLYYSVNGPVNMTQQETFSSTENWQLFSQSDVYFIRNYQAGAALQLGLTDNDLSVPRLLNSSGSLGQQWKLSSRADGTWRITNGLVSNSSSLGIAPGGATVPAMDTSDGDGHWDISINVSAGTISDAAMLASVANVETISTPSPTQSQSQSQFLSPTSTTTTTTTTTSTLPSNSNSKSSSLSGGAIAGIVIGILALALIIAALFFFLRRRKQKGPLPNQPPNELDGTGAVIYKYEKRMPDAVPVELDVGQR